MAAAVTVYNGVYVGLGMYYGEIGKFYAVILLILLIITFIIMFIVAHIIMRIIFTFYDTTVIEISDYGVRIHICTVQLGKVICVYCGGYL